MKRKIIMFFVMTFIIVCYSYFFTILDGDELCGYGFSYNIAKGAIPYKDFNMVVLPFYSLIMSIPLKLIANNLFVYHLFNAILFSIILTIIDDGKSFNSFCICLYMMIIPIAYSYNPFCVIILILILYLEKSNYKYKEEIIGILLGSILATKQNIGIILFIPYILHSKHKLKSIICYILPISFVIIYLFLNNALTECIDYCFLGLNNFQDNMSVFSFIFIIVELIILIYLIVKYKESKDINYLYLLCFQFITYPILDCYHIILAVIPITYYILQNNNNKYIHILLFIFPIIIGIRYIEYAVIEEKNSLSLQAPFKYRHINEERIVLGKKYINFTNENNNKRIFIFSYDAYYVKLLLNEKIDKFDLINKGNMGSDEYKYTKEIENICDKEECIFIMNLHSFEITQLNPILKNYVLENYEYCGNISENINYYCKKESTS